MELAIEHRTMKAQEMDEQIQESARSIALLTNIMGELQTISLDLPQEA